MNNYRIKPLAFKFDSQNEKLNPIDPEVRFIVGSVALTTSKAQLIDEKFVWEEDIDLKRSNEYTVVMQIWNRSDPEKKGLVGIGELDLEGDLFEAKKFNRWVDIKDLGDNKIGEMQLEVEYYPGDENIVLEEFYEGIPKEMLPHESNIHPGATMQRLSQKKLEISVETLETDIHDDSARYSYNYNRYSQRS